SGTRHLAWSGLNGISGKANKTVRSLVGGRSPDCGLAASGARTVRKTCQGSLAESGTQGSEPEEVTRVSDLLLEWMSFRGEGRLDSLPARDLASPPRRVVSPLVELGHAELTGKTSWRIAPPVLACLPSHAEAAPSAVLCGARTPGLLRRLEAACASVSAQ